MLVVVILIVQNHDAMSTEVTFRVSLFSVQYQSTNFTLYYIVTIAFLFGVIISGLYGIVERFRLKREIKVLTKVLQEKDNELNSLRNFPITSDDISAEKPDENL
jgi:uncharacterized integral membrane protein